MVWTLIMFQLDWCNNLCLIVALSQFKRSWELGRTKISSSDKRLFFKLFFFFCMRDPRLSTCQSIWWNLFVFFRSPACNYRLFCPTRQCHICQNYFAYIFSTRYRAALRFCNFEIFRTFVITASFEYACVCMYVCCVCMYVCCVCEGDGGGGLGLFY